VFATAPSIKWCVAIAGIAGTHLQFLLLPSQKSLVKYNCEISFYFTLKFYFIYSQYSHYLLEVEVKLCFLKYTSPL
jgi:hypothetical protein